MKLWAHRGCSQRYPENTILSFEKARRLYEKGLTGIELDVQLSKDGELVVIHDERVDRTTEGFGYVRDFSLSQLKGLHIYADENPRERIPTLEEVIDLIEDELKSGFKLNIELKNSIYAYEGMEQRVVDLVYKKGVQSSIVYSSFNAASLVRVYEIDNSAEIGILDMKASDCLWKIKGGCHASALHPYWQAMDIAKEELKGYQVRAWLSGHLYPEKPTGGRLDFAKYENMGITDMIINEPEAYL